jgi:twitching motility two-component system response regulator PilH
MSTLEPQPAHAAPPARSPRVLVIEDNPEVRQLLSIYLGRLGYEVLAAATGEEGLALARRDPPDVVFVDFYLPWGMNGRHVIEVLRATPDTAGCKIVAASAYETDEHGMDADVDLIKPFTVRDVDAVLTKIRALAPCG